MNILLCCMIVWLTALTSAYGADAKPTVIQASPTTSTPFIDPVVEEEDFQVGETPDTDSSTLPEPSKEAVKPEKHPAAKTDEAFSAALPELDTAEVSKNYTNMVLLQGLNKITARTSSLEAAIGTHITFGTLEIVVKQCWKSSPDETPDSKALLEIWEQKPSEARTQRFTGWMLASSPAISALEHPVYDITVIECKNKPIPEQAARKK